MSEIEFTPDPHLLESMRAVGYSFETAVADVIDNSIAACARPSTFCHPPRGSTSIDFRRWGWHGPQDRDSCDAAGSPKPYSGPTRIRPRTVRARVKDGIAVPMPQAHLGDQTEWSPHRAPLGSRPCHRQSEMARPRAARRHGEFVVGVEPSRRCRSGTLVCWNELDLLQMTEGSAQSDFDAAVTRVRDHCSLVFHRFVTGDDARKITMTVNGNGFAALDPFLGSNKATDRRTEDLHVGGEVIPVVAYTLPFINKLSASERQRALAPGGFRDSQGFYIYRAGRLVVWGTWFRLNPRTEWAS